MTATQIPVPDTKGKRFPHGSVGVDSGTMAIGPVSAELWQDNVWRERVIANYDEARFNGSITEGAAMSSTGYGDGYYPVHVIARDEVPVGVEVTFVDYPELRGCSKRVVGMFHSEDGKMFVGDPCYTEIPDVGERDDLRREVVLTPGTYAVVVYDIDGEEWGPRIGRLLVVAVPA